MSDSWRPVQESPARLLAAALRSCARSREMIEESRAVLERHRAVMALLRTSASAAPVPGSSPNGGAERGFDLDDEIVIGALRMLPLRRTVTGEAGRVLLTPAEWQLLAALVTHRSEVLGRSELASRAWGPGFADRHGEVEVYISRLRRKLTRAGGEVRIQTVRGQGYRLSLDDAAGVDIDRAAQQLGGGAA